MRNSGLIIVGIVAVAGVAISATNAMKPTYRPVVTTAVDAVACVDYEPPNSADFVKYKDVQYNIIKVNGGISEAKVKEEMRLVGDYNGKPLYIVEGKNYYGQPIGEDFIYVDSGKKNKNMRLFNIYIKSTIPTPDFVKNCKNKGGDKQMIDYWRTSQFPPAAFNTADAKDATVLTDPGYIWSDAKTTYNAVSQLKNIQPAGSLFVNSRNKEYPLYEHLGTVYLIDGNDAYEYIPTDKEVALSSEAKANLQLKWFFLVNTPVYSWFTPDCKPAVYLYPESTQQTTVKIDAKGPLTVTIPEYPQGGWDVVAEPNGTIHSEGKTFPYLYYEARIPDDSFNKPDTGYVVPFNELDSLYASVLPQLGLNAKETADFKEYWEKYLPYSPYYFVGVMPVAEVDAIEKLTINPAPDKTIRVRLFFEPLKDRKDVAAPAIASVPQRVGFTAVEWGGMVKMEPGSDFTCSQ